jgi:L-amino acid N-acyltransferase YncA
LFRARSVCRIHAFVKPGNQASVRLFEASGFQRAAPQQVAGQDAFLFILEGNVLEREVMENEILASKGLENEKLSHAE